MSAIPSGPISRLQYVRLTVSHRTIPSRSLLLPKPLVSPRRVSPTNPNHIAATPAAAATVHPPLAAATAAVAAAAAIPKRANLLASNVRIVSASRDASRRLAVRVRLRNLAAPFLDASARVAAFATRSSRSSRFVARLGPDRSQSVPRSRSAANAVAASRCSTAGVSMSLGMCP